MCTYDGHYKILNTYKKKNRVHISFTTSENYENATKKAVRIFKKYIERIVIKTTSGKQYIHGQLLSYILDISIINGEKNRKTKTKKNLNVVSNTQQVFLLAFFNCR